MDRKELLEKLSKVALIGKGRITIKEIDYTGNPINVESI